MKRPLIKICGVNDAAFALVAERMGANYLGFIFAEGSPRRVTPVTVRTIISALVGKAIPVGVFTTTPVEEIVRLAHDLGLRVIQLHRRAAAADIAFLQAQGMEVWSLAGGAVGDGLIFDSSHGDGETVLRRGSWRTILAGGISRENLHSALAADPDVIDVSGSLESTPGVKSAALLAEFMETFRQFTDISAD